MSTGSRFASLAQRVRGAMGQGDTSIIALATEGGGEPGQGGTEGLQPEEGVAPVPPAPPAPTPPPPPPAPTLEGEEGAAAQASAAAVATARAEERQRVTDVFASDASTGKERVAASLLADSDMAADKIVALLPKLDANPSNAMLANLTATKNPDLAPGKDVDPNPKADANASWDRTFARLGWTK